MKKILHFIKQPVFIAVMGLLLLSLLIWFAGPHIKFGEGNTAPLASAIIRLVCIIILLLLWGLNNLRSQLWANKQTTDLVEGLQDDQQTHSATSDQEAEELHQINQRFADALATLKKIKFTSKGRKKGLYELPWYIIIGPPGAGKTTALINSSLDFPLAEKFGKVALQGVGGTRNCDWWFTNEAVLVDTAGRYTTQSSHRVVDSSAWEGFLNLLKRHRRRRPINGVVVAVSVLDLLTQTEEERLQNAKLIRQRLDELMDKLQVRFPVYLILTKSDLMAGFTEFFEDLGRDEREQVWGISLPNAPQASQSPDFDYLSQEYDKLSTHIHERVLWRLHQERDPQRRGAIHGFPLQFESLRKIVEGFVQQTFIKNRYQFQPYLRGLYFTSGLQDGNPIDRLMTSLAANFGFSRETTATSTQQGKSFFLGDLFRYVIFPESELVGSNVRYERFIRWSQRAAYVALLVITVGVMAVWTGSVTRHKMFMSEVDSYVDEFIAENKRVQSWNQDIRTLLPGLGALAKASIVYDQQSHPWLNGIGMYDPRVDDQANQAYETKLTTLFLPKLIDTLEVFIKQGHGGGDLYNTFRTYMMFNKVEFMNRDLITDWFSRYWDKQYHGSGEVRQQLKKHLADLLSLNLAPNELDPRLVVDTRNLLLRVPVAQRIYSRLRTNPDYSQKIDMRNYIGESVRTSYDLSANRLAYLQVPYLFTIEGYKAIDLSKGSPMIASIVNEDWVLSDDNSERVDFLEDDLDEISRQVEALYLSEYSRIWVNLYQGLAVTEFKNLSHASNVLASFTDPVYSPLVSILQVGKTNTQLSVPLAQNLADDNAEGNLGKATRYLADTFEGNTVDKRFRELNVLLRESSQRPAPIAGIIQQIQQLQSFVNEITIAPDPSQQSFDIVKARYSSGSGNAITALKGYAKNTPEPVKTWLNTLADESWKVILRSSRGHVNNEWRERVYRPYAQGLAGRYPLNARSSNELALQDFSEFFKPAGTLDAFFQEYMKPFLNTRGTWGNRSVGDNNMGFSANTLRQVRRAMAIRNAFFRANPETPTIRMELRPQSMDEQHARFTLELGDERVTYRHGPKFWKTLNWSGDDDNKRIRVIFEDLDGQVYEQTYEGPWAWFRFQDASSLKPIRGSNVYLATFYVRDKNSRDHKITYEIRAKSANNPFRKGLLSSFRSPESI